MGGCVGQSSGWLVFFFSVIATPHRSPIKMSHQFSTPLQEHLSVDSSYKRDGLISFLNFQVMLNTIPYSHIAPSRNISGSNIPHNFIRHRTRRS